MQVRRVVLMLVLVLVDVGCGKVVQQAQDAGVDAPPGALTLTLSEREIEENWQLGTSVGALALDGGSAAARFALADDVAGCAGPDNAAFAIDGATLTTARMFDVEESSTYTICVEASAGDTTSSVSFEIEVLDRQEVATGANHSCAIRADRSLWCWGADNKGQLGDGTVTGSQQSPVQVPGAWATVAAGAAHTCAIATDGSLWCWGADDRGQLGNADAGNQNAPTRVGADATWTHVTAGTGHTCATRRDGTLWCWGADANGQLGNGATISATQHEPSQVDGATWVEVAAGHEHTCATRVDASLWCWGKGADGRLGDGETVDRLEPVAIAPGGATWARVRAGQDHTCATRTDGTLWCWGANSAGQLGTDDTQPSSTPVAVPSPAAGGWTDARIAAGSLSTCAAQGGALYCWGAVNATQTIEVPIQIGAETTWRGVEIGVNHWCATRTDRSLACWGSDANTSGTVVTGKLGNGPYIIANVDVPEGGLYTPDWVSIDAADGARGGFSASTGHTCAIRVDRTLWCWGNDSFNQLGDDATVAHQAAPVQVGTDASWSKVAAGFRHTCGTRTDGTLWCWGDDGSGQLGNGATITGRQVAPLRVNNDTDWADVSTQRLHTYGLKSNGELYCWGYGARCGVNSTSDLVAPTRVGTNLWKAISAGPDTSCGIRDDDKLFCWGDGAYLAWPTPNQLGTASWKQVATGPAFACGINSEDRLFCWGWNTALRLGINNTNGTFVMNTPTEVFNGGTWKAVGAGSYHACGIKTDGSLWCWGGNTQGQLGLGISGSGLDRATPQRVGTATSWATVTGGTYHTCATRTDGTALCWGYDDYGQLGNTTAAGHSSVPHLVPPQGPTAWSS